MYYRTELKSLILLPGMYFIFNKWIRCLRFLFAYLAHFGIKMTTWVPKITELDRFADFKKSVIAQDYLVLIFVMYIEVCVIDNKWYEY